MDHRIHLLDAIDNASGLPFPWPASQQEPLLLFWLFAPHTPELSGAEPACAWRWNAL